MLHVNHPQHVNLVSHVHHIHHIHISTVINEVIGLLATNLMVNKQEKAYMLPRRRWLRRSEMDR